MFGPQASLPSIKYHSDRMAFTLPIPGEGVEQAVARRFEAPGSGWNRHPRASQQVISIDKKMCRHLQLRSLRPFVDNTINI